MNNWIAKNANLQQQVTALMTKNDGWYDKKMKEYKNARGFLPQNELPIKDFVVHRELDRIHDIAFDAAWNALERYKSQFTDVGRELSNRKFELRRGNVDEAKKTNKRVQTLLKDTRNK